MSLLQDAVDAEVARTGFSGVVRVDRAGGTELARACGLADRAHSIANTMDTQFATASITKGFTALAVMALVESGTLDLSTTARSVLGNDLPLIADDVTVEHLLAHRSGIGDYFDEHGVDITDYVLPVPVHRLASTEQYLAVLGGHETAFAADQGFAYCNGGYVVLALIAERAAGVSYHDLVRTLVWEPAGMVDSAFLRTDELPGRAAVSYLRADGLRTNILHLPVLGTGDGGAYSTVADLHALWAALFAGRIIPLERVAQMVRPRSDWPDEKERYGLGFHLHQTGAAVWLEGYDAGVSCLTLHDPSTGDTWTVISNWSQGSWPLVSLLNRTLNG
jgi:CubicO group peptidase (beta-lactamase class C family)